MPSFRPSSVTQRHTRCSAVPVVAFPVLSGDLLQVLTLNNTAQHSRILSHRRWGKPCMLSAEVGISEKQANIRFGALQVVPSVKFVRKIQDIIEDISFIIGRASEAIKTSTNEAMVAANSSINNSGNFNGGGPGGLGSIGSGTPNFHNQGVYGTPGYNNNNNISSAGNEANRRGGGGGQRKGADLQVLSEDFAVTSFADDTSGKLNNFDTISNTHIQQNDNYSSSQTNKEVNQMVPSSATATSETSDAQGSAQNTNTSTWACSLASISILFEKPKNCLQIMGKKWHFY